MELRIVTTSKGAEVTLDGKTLTGAFDADLGFTMEVSHHGTAGDVILGRPFFQVLVEELIVADRMLAAGNCTAWDDLDCDEEKTRLKAQLKKELIL